MSEEDTDRPDSRRLIVMGVTGSGKSTIGEGLAEALGSVFLDGDDHHPETNVQKMASGQPLSDEDRWPWLDRLGEVLEDAVAAHGRAVLACSALRRVYRERLTKACKAPPLFVHLSGSRALIHGRMQARTDHFMPVGLLDSQLATLEVPASDENALSIGIEQPTDQVVANILTKLNR